jgi:hypothetical protein
MLPPNRPPHPAKVVVDRAPHPATVVQPRVTSGRPAARPPHAAKVWVRSREAPARRLCSPDEATWLHRPDTSVQRSSDTKESLGGKEDFALISAALKSALSNAIERSRPEFVELNGGWEGWFQVEVATSLTLTARKAKRELSIAAVGRSDLTIEIPKTSSTKVSIHAEMGCQSLSQSTSDSLVAKMVSDAKKYSGGHCLLALVSAGTTEVLKSVYGSLGEVVKGISKSTSGGTTYATSDDGKMMTVIQYLVT